MRKKIKVPTKGTLADRIGPAAAEDFEKWNAEADAKINKMLEEAGLAMPIIPKKFKNMNAKQIYAKLKKGE